MPWIYRRTNGSTRGPYPVLNVTVNCPRRALQAAPTTLIPGPYAASSTDVTKAPSGAFADPWLLARGCARAGLPDMLHPESSSMRYIDEVLALYPGKDPFTRKFILAQLLDHPVDHHAGDILDMLREELKASEAVVRRQARYTLGQYLPPAVAASFGLDPDTHATEPARRLAAGAAAWLEPQLQELMAILLERGSMPERSAVSFLLGRLHTPAIIGELVDQVAGVGQVSYQAAFALAEAGDEAAVAGLVQAAREHGASKPDVLMLLRGIPCPATLACLEAAESKADANGRANIAMALAQFASSACRGLLEKLVERREGWVSAYVLDTLAGSGDSDDLPLIRRAFELEAHEFIRVQAVRAAGTIRSEASRAFCEEVLRTSPGRLQSVALEALAAQNVPQRELAALATPLLESEFVRTRVQAMLILAREDADRIVPALDRMILASEALLRLEGAFVTGLLRGPGSRALLERMVESDPSAPVRLQAVRSLGRLPADEAVPALAPVLAHPALRMVATACRTLAGLADRPAVAAALAAAVPAAAGPGTRAIILEALGSATRAAGQAPPDALFASLADPEPATRMGALGGLAALGRDIPVERVMPLLIDADPRVRARAAAGAFLGGQPEQTGVLTAMLAGGVEAESLAALAAMLDIALAAPLGAAAGYAKLAAKLDARAPAEVPATPVAVEPKPMVLKHSAAHAIPLSVKGSAPTTSAAALAPRSMQRVASLRKVDLLKALAEASAPDGQMMASSRDLRDLATDYAKKAAAKAMAGASTPHIVLPFTPKAVPPSGKLEPNEMTQVGHSRPLVMPRRRKRPPEAAGANAGRRGLLAALAVSVAMTGALVWRIGSETVAPPLRASVRASTMPVTGTRLRVFTARGTCSGTVTGAPVDRLAVGTYLDPGDRVETGTSGQLILRSGHGTQLELGPAARVAMDQPEPAPSGKATLVLDLQETGRELALGTDGDAVLAKLGPYTYRIVNGQIRITARPGGWEVEQLSGDGYVQRGSGAREVVVAGHRQNLGR